MRLSSRSLRLLQLPGRFRQTAASPAGRIFLSLSLFPSPMARVATVADPLMSTTLFAGGVQRHSAEAPLSTILP